VVELIRKSSLITGCRGIQIDFDARISERPFYRSLLASVRRELPDSVSLSITALASWCLADVWVTGLPVDDAIPMLFRLGPDRAKVLNHLGKGGDFAAAICRQSIGVSIDEPFPQMRAGRRVYVFNPMPWTEETYQDFMKRLQR
jgi:hypothetical protein